MNIGIREARPGMTLAEDIMLPEGGGQLHKSRQLNGETINLLIHSGISHINIVDPSHTGAADDAPESPAQPAQPEPDQAVPPKLDVVVDQDAMSARLIIDPAGPVSEELSADAIMKALECAGVLYGINAKMVAAAVQKWELKKHHYEFDQIAKGTLPEPGKEGAYHFKVNYLTDIADVEAVRKLKFYWEAVEQIGRPPLVQQDAVMAEKRADTPPVPGTNIKDEPILTDQITPAQIQLGEGVAFSQDRKLIIARSAGIPYCVNDTIGLLSVNLNGSVDVAVDSDRMAARLIIRHPAEGGGMPSLHEIETRLAAEHICWGVDNEALKRLVEGFGEGRYPPEPVTIAQGTPPENGDNGKIEYLFNTSTSLAPKLNPDGSVDYKCVDIVIPVSKGHELARLQPPTAGSPGKNILGEAVPCKPGNPAIMPIGPNTELHPQNEDILIASKAGLVRYTGSYAEVSEGYVIAGDVDFSTGNVKYGKSVVVNGDVKSGFSVECGGDLQVSGIIEDCAMNIRGNVLCKHGFIGQGKGALEAKGDVNLGFLMNQCVKSRKSVNIAREALNGTINARQSISVHGKPTSVAGGTLVARDSITVYAVGNESGVRTVLEVGVDFTLAEELMKTEEQEADFKAKHRKILDASKKYQHLAAVKKHLMPQEELFMSRLKIALAKMEELLRVLEERKKIIQEKLHDVENAFIKIEHSAMPGTFFKIGDRRFLVKEEIVGPKTVRLIRQEIHIL